MTPVYVLGFLLVLIGLCLGFVLGVTAAIRSLLIGVERDDRTPHKLGDRFYYLVPESEYAELRKANCRPRTHPVIASNRPHKGILRQADDQ